MKQKPTVGEKLFTLNVGNAARHRPQVLTPVVVAKVGRKYFTVQTEEGAYRLETVFAIDDWREKTECTPNAHLYSSEREWADEKEEIETCNAIADAFRYGHNTRRVGLDGLRTILGIITPTEDATA